MPAQVFTPAAPLGTGTMERLDVRARAALVEHFLALTIQDRRLRFGTPLVDTSIAAYVDRIDFDRDTVFGIRDQQSALVGVAHVAHADDLAELGLSVLPAYRRVGIGGAMVEWAAAYLRKRGIPGLCMRFFAGNTPIVRIARRFGMEIISSAGEAEAYLKLVPFSASMAGELAT